MYVLTVYTYRKILKEVNKNMMRSMYASVSGLKVHQQMMDVIGNNISNINTTGYKGSRVTFQQMLTQTLKGASAPDNNKGGTNPQQIGLGVSTASIDSDMTGGNLQPTGKTTDVALQGDGFFVVSDGEKDMYTRAGSFSFDSNGYLVSTTSGYRVKGWLPEGNDEFDTSAEAEELDLNTWLKGQPMAGQATSEITYSGNLDASAGVGDTHTIISDVYDSLGERHTIEFTIEKTGINAWEVDGGNLEIDGVAAGSFDIDPSTITFNSDGSVDEANTDTPTLTITAAELGNGAAEINAQYDFSDFTQFSGEMTADYKDDDGYKEGYFQSLSIDARGIITGSFDNGQNKPLAMLAVAKFSNPEGLLSEGGLFNVSNNSGDARLAGAGINGRGELATSSLEMSNVDLAAQFTDMITAQRGFQASSKMISTSDEMLQDLVNMKR